jgi:hypothetical protein
MAESTLVKIPGWGYTLHGGARKNIRYARDIIEPAAVGVNRAAYTSDAESAAYTATNPSDSPASADALRDDLVANTIPAIYTSVNALRTAYENLRSYVEDLVVPNHATTNKWQGVPVRFIADAVEFHYAWVPMNSWNSRRPVYVALLFIPNHASSGATITGTYDRVTFGWNGDAAAGADGATAFDLTLPAITDAATTADTPIASYLGKINGSSTESDGLFFKFVAASCTGANRLQLAKMIVFYETL